MYVIDIRNVHNALPEALRRLENYGVTRDSRNGPVRMFARPTTTVYHAPRERVVFWPERDCNPFFHVMESLWMLAGRNDVEYVAQFVNRMRSFSDDGVTLHGAYGYRWRKHFHYDQLIRIINALRENPDDRRQVLSMWDAAADLGRKGKDLPCNLQATFQINCEGELDMMVTNRSNDMIWGAYGANAVHFSYLQEFVATAVGVPVGKYWQVSANFHAYLETLKQVEGLAKKAHDPIFDPNFLYRTDPYSQREVQPYPLMQTPFQDWQEDLIMFIEEGPVMGLRDPFFRKVAGPMYNAYKAYKSLKGEERYDVPLEHLTQCAASDWRKACEEWIQRRRAQAILRQKRAQDDGVAYD